MAKHIKRDAICYYISNAYTLTPLSGKIPTTTKWQHTKFNPRLTEADFSNNFGVVLQSDDLVIDYDPRNDKDKNSLSRLIRDLNLPITLKVLTGSDGIHLYYKKPKEVEIKCSDCNYPGIDFLSKGKQVVGVGSLHPKTNKQYVFENIMSAVQAPQSLLNYLSKSVQVAKQENQSFNDSPDIVEKFISYLKSCPIAIEGRNGDRVTLETAQKAILFGLSEDKTFELMIEYYNPRCLPAWNLEELKSKVMNAYKYSEKLPIGSLDPRNSFHLIDDNFDGLKNILKPISEVKMTKSYQWIVKNLFARGFISIIFGDPGSGKTWLILVLCLSLSNGSTLWNGIFVNKSKVLLLEGDSPDALLKTRLEKLDEKLNDDYFSYVNRYTAEKKGMNLSLSDTKGRKNLETIIKAYRPDFVVIDTLISFINDEKDAEGIKRVIDELRIFAEKYNCHISICHHSRKRMTGEKRKSLDQSDVIGSSVITRLASVVIGVERNEG